MPALSISGKSFITKDGKNHSSTKIADRTIPTDGCTALEVAALLRRHKPFPKAAVENEKIEGEISMYPLRDTFTGCTRLAARLRHRARNMGHLCRE
jgi:hypothetical protein